MKLDFYSSLHFLEIKIIFSLEKVVYTPRRNTCRIVYTELEAVLCFCVRIFVTDCSLNRKARCCGICLCEDALSNTRGKSLCSFSKDRINGTLTCEYGQLKIFSSHLSLWPWWFSIHLKCMDHTLGMRLDNSGK